jgi:hypothetical protein
VTRWVVAGAAAVLAFAGVAVAVLALIQGEPVPPLQAAPPRVAAQLPGVLPPGPPTPSEVADAAEASRLDALLEARERYRAFRDGFRGPASAASYARLAPAIRTVWPGAEPRWVIDCRGGLCRVEVDGPPEERRAALDGSPAVRAATEGPVVADPDGLERPFFLVVARGAAPAGDHILERLAKELAESAEAQACLSRGVAGEVTYHVTLNTTGITYRTSGTLPWEVVDCVNGALTDLLLGLPQPKRVRQATRAVLLTAR